MALSRKNLWEATPRALKGVVGKLTPLVPPSVLLGRHFRRSLAFLDRAQWWDRERARAYQLEQVRAVVRWAYERTPFYRELYRGVGFEPGDLKALEDLRGLPTIDKTTLRDHLAAMCAKPPSGAGVDRVSTGGSSGEPLHFYIGTDRSAIEYAHLVSSWQRAGYSLDVPQAVLRGQVVAPDHAGLRHEYDPILRRHAYSNFHMTDAHMRSYVEHMRTIGPFFLHVYPSSALVLARFVERAGIAPPANLRGILAGSETVFAEDRAFVESVFGVRYYSWYGHSEKLVLGAECEHHSGYHVWPTYGHLELLEGREPVEEAGGRGEIVGTGFINRVVPFIRYRTDDWATYAAERCAHCGREHVVLADVEGRLAQTHLIAGDRSAISMTAFNLHDDTFEGVAAYQFDQREAGRALLRIRPARELAEGDRRRILAGANARLQGQVTLTLEVADELVSTPRGKQPRVLLAPGLQAELERQLTPDGEVEEHAA